MIVQSKINTLLFFTEDLINQRKYQLDTINIQEHAISKWYLVSSVKKPLCGDLLAYSTRVFPNDESGMPLRYGRYWGNAIPEADQRSSKKRRLAFHTQSISGVEWIRMLVKQTSGNGNYCTTFPLNRQSWGGQLHGSSQQTSESQGVLRIPSRRKYPIVDNPNQKTTIPIGTQKVRSLYMAAKLDNVINEIKRISNNK